jgi:MFS family permease
MSGFETEVDGREEPTQTPAAPNSVEAVRSSSAAIGRTLVVGVLIALAGAWIASTLADRFRFIENVQHSVKYPGMRGEFPSTKLDIGRATQNAAVAYGLLGAILSLILGVTAGCFLGRFSIPRVLAAGLGGIVLGASFGAASSYGLTPIYFHRMGTADVTLSLLIHLGIWSAVGAALGVAFGLGSGSRDVLVRSLVGGITGAALGTILFEICGAFFPLARTERPLSEVAATRLAANIVLCLCVVSGIGMVASQKTRVTADKA